MGYHPETLVFSFPPYPRRKGGIGQWLYSLEPWIGFDVWHIDPERPGTGNRTDDSCGWFDRTPGEYAWAVAELTDDTAFMHDVRLILARQEPMPYPFYEGISDRHMTGMRLPAGEAVALVAMVASELERLRWWRGPDGQAGAHQSVFRRTFTRKRDVLALAFDLALNPTDNLSRPHKPDGVVRTVAAALNRRFRPWWKHPRWHVHHWQINVSLFRNLRRMVQPCATCGKPLGFGYCPHSSGGKHHHSECLGIGEAAVSDFEAGR